SETIFAALLVDALVPMPGLFELLDQIESQSIPLAVATSSNRRFAEQMLGSFDLIPRLNFLLTGNDVVRGKPHPEMYLAAAARFGVQPENMLVLEDSQNGCIAAAEAGACTIAVPGEHCAGHCYDLAFLQV